NLRRKLQTYVWERDQPRGSS
ncbi:mCG146550, partial [Mus musculus]